MNQKKKTIAKNLHKTATIPNIYVYQMKHEIIFSVSMRMCVL